MEYYFDSVDHQNRCKHYLTKMFTEWGGPLYDIVFSPMTDAMSVVRKNKRQKVAGSLKMKMPTTTAPTAARLSRRLLPRRCKVTLF